MLRKREGGELQKDHTPSEFKGCGLDKQMEAAVEEKAQLLSGDEEEDSSALGGSDCEIHGRMASGTSVAEDNTQEEEISPPPGDATSSLEASSDGGSDAVYWRRLISRLFALRKTWFVMETFMLFRLAFPLVRSSYKVSQTVVQSK